VTIQTVVVPDLGGAETVEVIELGLSPGDSVEVEDSLLVLESDKATMDIPSPATGVLTRYLVDEGATVKVGDAIAEIDVAGEAAATDVADAEEVEQVSHQPAADSEPESDSEPEAKPQPSAAQSSAEQMIKVPDIGSDDKVDVIEICVAVGDEVNEGDTLVVLESDKATMDVPSTHSGKVLKIVVAEGDKLGTGDDVALFEVIADVAAVQEPAVKQPAPAPVAATPVSSETGPQKAAAAVSAASQPGAVQSAPGQPAQPATSPAEPRQNNAASDIYAGPAVRLIARELGVELSQVPGSGPRGRILKDDVSNFVKQVMQNKDTPAAAAGGSGIPAIPAIDFSQFGDIEELALSKIQKLTAANMQRN